VPSSTSRSTWKVRISPSRVPIASVSKAKYQLMLPLAVGTALDLEVESIGPQQLGQVVAQHRLLIGLVAAVDRGETLDQVVVERHAIRRGSRLSRWRIKGLQRDVSQQVNTRRNTAMFARQGVPTLTPPAGSRKEAPDRWAAVW
jgi:hypothetical protein